MTCAETSWACTPSSLPRLPVCCRSAARMLTFRRRARITTTTPGARRPPQSQTAPSAPAPPRWCRPQSIQVSLFFCGRHRAVLCSASNCDHLYFLPRRCRRVTRHIRASTCHPAQGAEASERASARANGWMLPDDFRGIVGWEKTTVVRRAEHDPRFAGNVPTLAGVRAYMQEIKAESDRAATASATA